MVLSGHRSRVQVERLVDEAFDRVRASYDRDPERVRSAALEASWPWLVELWLEFKGDGDV